MRYLVWLSLVITFHILPLTSLHAQQRDRRVDLKVRCMNNVCISPTGKIWMISRCGEVYSAEDIHDTWHTAFTTDDPYPAGMTFDHIASFDNHTAVVAGFIASKEARHYDFALRTITDGHQWDTVYFGRGTHWIHGFCHLADGHLWMGSNEGLLTFSADSGRTFTVLRDTAFERKQGIDDIYMLSADSGWIAGHGNRIYSTHDNWHSWHRWPTPLDQKLYTVTDPHDQYWVTRIRSWNNHLLAIEAGMSFFTPLGDSLHWQHTWQPLTSFEVDTMLGNLWAITDNGQLLCMSNLEHRHIVRENLQANIDYICGIHDGYAYLNTSEGVVRISPNGKADTCGHFTEERTLTEVFDKMIEEYSEYCMEVLPTFLHGDRLWRNDGTSIYLQDALGWYRIAKPFNIRKMFPDPDRNDRVIILCYDNRNYSIDTAGHMESFTYHQPLASFVQSGLQNVKISTYVGGCFHYDQHTIGYTRQDNRLCESENTVDSNQHKIRNFSADSLEHVLLQMGDLYDRFPTTHDFGLEEDDIDLKRVFFGELGGCTSYSGYEITFVNRKDDTLIISGNSNIDCGDYFPWMLPMTVTGDSAAFVSYQPLLWQALRPMMPKGMMHRNFLSNLSLIGLRPCDLLFFHDTTGMGSAINESSGKYTHVALVESVEDTIWIIDATPEYGVARRPLFYDFKDAPDIYRLKNHYSKHETLKRARTLIGKPYDNAFLPDNDAYYCSELIQTAFGDLFESKPMNWRDKEGNLPEYWQKHFKELGIPVPEGVPGTNPTDLSHSPLLKRIQ